MLERLRGVLRSMRRQGPLHQQKDHHLLPAEAAAAAYAVDDLDHIEERVRFEAGPSLDVPAAVAATPTTGRKTGGRGVSSGNPMRSPPPRHASNLQRRSGRSGNRSDSNAAE